MAKMTVKLFATMMVHLPVNSTKSHGFDYQLKDETSVGYLIDDLKLPRNVIHLVLLNGIYVCVQDFETTMLKDGDVLAFWPQVAGG
jgi:molybdopterin converting factor small subunit